MKRFFHRRSPKCNDAFALWPMLSALVLLCSLSTDAIAKTANAQGSARSAQRQKECESTGRTGLKTLDQSLAKALPQSCGELQTLQARLEKEMSGAEKFTAQSPIESLSYQQKSSTSTQSSRSLYELDGLKRLAVRKYDACHADLLRACYPNRKPTIALNDLKKLYSDIRADSRFKMKDPQNSCFARAYLLGKHLTEKGYKVKTVNIEAPAIIGVQSHDADATAHAYASHVVVVIAANEPNGSVRNYVLDPQFEGNPVEESEYIRRTIGVPCTKDESDLSKLCVWQEGEPTQALGPRFRSGEDGQYKTQLRLKDPCGWSMEADFLAIVKQKEPSLQDSPQSDQWTDSDDVQNSAALQARVLRRFLEVELQRTQLNSPLPGRRETIKSKNQLNDVKSILKRALAELPVESPSADARADRSI